MDTLQHSVAPVQTPHWSDEQAACQERELTPRELEVQAWLESIPLKPFKPQTVSVPAATYSHVGAKPHTGNTRRSSYLSGHTDPKPGKVHALNRKPGNGYVGLCGERVPLMAEDVYGNEVVDHVEEVAGQRVTCKRCRKVLGL